MRTMMVRPLSAAVSVASDGKEQTYYIYNNCKHQDAYNETGMQGVSYTTGVPAMAGAMMFFKGLWRNQVYGTWKTSTQIHSWKYSINRAYLGMKSLVVI